MAPPGTASSNAPGTAPTILLRAELLAKGLSDNHIRRARQLGLLTAILPGVYLPQSTPGELDRRSAHRAELGAVLGRIGGDPVVSHVSAALLHGLPLLDAEPTVVHVIRPGAAKSRKGVRFSAHRATLAADDIVQIDGLAVTSVARTVVDCAVILPRAEALPIARTALEDDRVSVAALAAQLARRARVPGVRAATEVIEHATQQAGVTPQRLSPRW